MTALGQCAQCSWHSHWLDADSRCHNCALGWTFCVAHVRLEWARSAHARVTVHDVVRMVASSSAVPPDPAGIARSDICAELLESGQNVSGPAVFAHPGPWPRPNTEVRLDPS